MGKKATKATRKFAASGQLKKTIQQRRKHQDKQRKAQKRKGNRGAANQDDTANVAEDEDDEENTSKFQGMSVDDFLGGEFMNGGDESQASDSDDGDLLGEDSEGEGSVDFSDNQSFASVDDLEDDEGKAHISELANLAEKDPEFYKYLQENDKELLEFDPNAMALDEEMDDTGADDSQETKAPILTLPLVRKWSKALLEQRSLRALRRLLIAFRAAAHMNEDDQVLAWTIDSPTVYNKLVTTTLRFTPVVLEHHCPHKDLPNGKFKAPTQTPKWKGLQKMILSYFNNVIHLVSQLTDNGLLELAVTESAKVIPYITSNRRTVKLFQQSCLSLWSSGSDSVRISAFLALRKLAMSTDESILNMVLKSTYLTLVRSCKSTSAHTLPSINLMKNSASEIYTIDSSVAYQHAFGYIRQLAIHLRNSMKAKTKDAYKQVYNWQFVHCIDFWSIVLARSCDRDSSDSETTELRALIYPLVQVSLGAIRLIPNARSYPLHLHILRSMLHLTRHTHVYVPLAPYLLPILTSTLSSSKPKASTARPLDFETNIRAPQQYLKTRVYSEGLAEEATYLLAEYLSSSPVHASVAFPEIVVPLAMSIRKMIKNAKGASWKAKAVSLSKTLVERIEESAKWVELKRKGVAFAPGRMQEVETWERAVKVEDTPLGKYVRVQKKAREKRKKLMEKAREGEDEILED